MFTKKEIKKAKEILKRDPNIDIIPAIIGEEVEIKEEVADITIQKDVGKMKINQVALKVMTNARRFGLKASLNGNYVRISGPKKK